MNFDVDVDVNFDIDLDVNLDVDLEFDFDSLTRQLVVSNKC